MTKHFLHFLEKYVCLITFLSVMSATSLVAQAHNSTQAHENAVTSVISLETTNSSNDSFYSAGSDGFVIKWTSDTVGEHYQLSELPIRLITRNPNGTELAVYETDGVSINRVSVWDWKTLTRKFAKRFSDTVTSISYSEQGTYLIVATAAMNGIYFIDASTGSILKKTAGTPSIVSLIKTGSSEKTAIIYSPSGSLVYYDIANGKQKAKFTVESSLEQPILFGTGDTEDCFLAGTKNNCIYIIYALSGKTIAQYQAKNPLIFCSESSSEDGLYYTTFDGKEYSLRLIKNDVLKTQIKANASAVINPPAALILKNFIGPKQNDGITCVAKNTNKIMLGSKSGNLYTMNDIAEAEKLTLLPISEKMYDKIFDITSDGKNFYFITKNAVYKTSYDTGAVDRVGTNPSQMNCMNYKDGVILWSKDTKKSVQYLPLSSGSTAAPQLLFQPTNALQIAHRFNNKIVYIQGTSSVGLYNLDTKTNQEVYSGTALQDAVLYNDTDLYVAKTAAVAPATSLLQVNISTQETVPLKISGTIAYSLSYDESKPNSLIYGISVITNDDNNFVTKVFSFSPQEKILTNLLQLSDEDPNAFTTLTYPMLYTNIGKSNVRSYNLESYKTVQLNRSASMPVKVVSTENRVAVLNRDGSISWYDTNNQNILSDWYLTVDGQWFAF